MHHPFIQKKAHDLNVFNTVLFIKDKFLIFLGTEDIMAKWTFLKANLLIIMF